MNLIDEFITTLQQSTFHEKSNNAIEKIFTWVTLPHTHTHTHYLNRERGCDESLFNMNIKFDAFFNHLFTARIDAYLQVAIVFKYQMKSYSKIK